MVSVGQQHLVVQHTAVPPSAAAAGGAGCGLSSVEQASSLITSCARKAAEKRRADCGVPQQGKRARQQADDAAARQAQDQDQDQEDGCTSDVSIDDQENLARATQYPAQLPYVHNTLRHMLAPFVPGWAPASQALSAQQLLALQQQGAGQAVMLEAQAPELCAAAAQEDALAWSDETVACSEEGLNNNTPSSSSAPTVSQPGGSTAGHSLQSVPQHVCLQQQQQAHAHADPAGTLQAQAGTCSVEGGTAVTSAGGNSAEDSEELEYDEDDFDPFTFISGLGPVDRYAPPGRQPLLPRQTRACKQKTLVLDLDETLVHSTLDAGYGAGADFSFPVLFNGCEHMVHVRTRPHMQAFLESVAEKFEVVVFTASQKVYAEKLLNILDPQRTLIRHRIYRDSCVLVEGNYLKDLSVLGRDLSRCAIVDNSPQAFGFQLSNGIPIESWYDDPTDNELPALLPFLDALADAGVDDVRPVIQAKFQLDQRVAMAGGRFRRLQQQEQAAALMVAQVAAGCAADCVSVHELIMQQPAQQAQEQAA